VPNSPILLPREKIVPSSKMKQDYDCIVIGAGVGGSTCGAILAHSHVKTLIVEKNNRIGGSCSYYEKDGFKVDTGTHMFSRGEKGPFGEVQKRIGTPNRIEFRQISNLVRMKGMGLNIVLHASLLKLPVFFFQLFHGLQIKRAELSQVIKLFLQFFIMSDRRIKEWDQKTLDEFIAKYTLNSAIYGFLAFWFGLYFVLPWWKASAGEAIWCFKKMLRHNALSYPKGGAVQIPKTFLDTAKKDGAKILTNASIKRIIVENYEVRGVELGDGRRYYSKIVVSTTSLKDSVLNLIGEKHFPSGYVKNIKETKGSFTAVQAKIALDKKLVDAGCLLALTPLNLQTRDFSIDLWRDFFEAVNQGKIPDIYFVYCPVPTNFDSDLAPEGKQLLTACGIAPTTDIDMKDPPEKWIDCLMESLRQSIPTLDDHVLWYDTLSVNDLEKIIGKTHAPVITTAQTPDQVGEKRPAIKSPIKGLYFAGDCAGGRGIGTELAAQSGIECADLILKQRAMIV
jgi:prolycopene isomerase